MIKVTRLRGKEFSINAELIESAEETPDTVVTLTSGRKHLVLEKVDVIIERVIEYRRRLIPPAPPSR